MLSPEVLVITQATLASLEAKLAEGVAPPMEVVQSLLRIAQRVTESHIEIALASR